MLVLSRKVSESLTIGNVTVTVSQIKNGRVRLAIAAPKEVKVLRSELPKREEAA